MSLEKEASNISEKISLLKRSTQIYLNKIHGCSENENYWWFVAGYYSIVAWSVIKYYEDDRAGLLSLIKQGPMEGVIPYILRARMERYKDEKKYHRLNGQQVNGLEFTPEVASINYINLNFQDSNDIVDDVYPRISGFAFRIYNKYCSSLGKLNKYKRIDNLEQGVYGSLEEVFNNLLPFFLPNSLTIFYPKFLSKMLKNINVKRVVTRHGLDLNIFQLLILGGNYSRKGFGEWLTITGHGFGTNISIDSIYYYSLQYKPQNVWGNHLKMNQFPRREDKVKVPFSVLVVPSERPLPYMLYDKKKYIQYEKMCGILIDLLSSECFSSLNIKIRFKDDEDRIYKADRYLKGNLLAETRSFEESYQDYDLVITTTIATVAGKCIYNKINFIGLYYPYELTEEVNYLWVISNKNVFSDFPQFTQAVKFHLNKMLIQMGGK